MQEAMVTGLYPDVLGKGPWLKLGENYRQNDKIKKNTDKIANSGTRFILQKQRKIDVFCHNMKL